MNNLCIYGSATVLGYLGWIAASPYGIIWAFAVSSLGAIVGVVVGWKIARRIG